MNLEIRGQLQVWRRALALSWSVWRAGVVIRGTSNLINRLLRGPLQAFALQRIVEDATQGRPVDAVWGGLLIGSLAALIPVDRIWHYIDQKLGILAIAATEEALLKASLEPTGLNHLEDPSYADSLAVARERAAAVILLSNWLMAMTAELLVVTLSAVLLAAIHPGLVLALALAGGLAPVHARVRRHALAVIDRTLPGQRLAGSLFSFGRRPDVVREIQLLGLADWVVGKHRRERLRVLQAMRQAEVRPLLLATGTGALQGAILAAGLAALLLLSGTGAVSAGEAAAAVILLTSSLDLVVQLGLSGSDLARNGHAAAHLVRILDFSDSATDSVPRVKAPDSFAGRPGIELRDLGFTYPWAEGPALSDLNLSIAPGTVVALVGENGAGKSTLVRLLCRLYDPTTGAILVGGTDLRDIDPAEWRARLTGAFQDFMKFKFLARESIGVGQLEASSDLGRVRGAADDARVTDALDALPEGFANQLGREYANGADLSEGQWQKVALARTAMRMEPLLTVLDEPTSALDPLAEEAVFRQYAARAAAAKEVGGVTVLVSHRFSTVALADLIVVLDGGRIIETGSHEDLVAQNGLYAELYGMQASRYR